MNLEHVVPWGRSLEEYQRMFALTESDQHLKILGCGDGPASFNFEMTHQGYNVTSIDPIYEFSVAQIEQQIQKTADTIVTQLAQASHDYIWVDYPDVQQLASHRLATMQKFLADFEKGKTEKRYQAQSLPALDFADYTFDLALCSHFLFLYSSQLSLEFHCAAIEELCRVAKEVRIFPLLGLDCQPSPYLKSVQQMCASRGFKAEIVKVAYEFQKGGNEMLQIRRLAP